MVSQALKNVRCGLVVSTAFFASSPVVAQTQDSPAPSEVQAPIRDIIVTARRRAENLQSVPIATTAVDGDDLRDSGIRRAAELTEQVPNLQINGSSLSVPKITIRGVGTNDFLATVQSAVGTYVDEVYIGPATAQNLLLFDIDRVEVLRGPQGTLYGKNTTGGAINYYSKLPTPDFGGGGSVTVGEYSRFEAEGHVNVPLSDSWAARAAFTERNRAGYFTSILGGPKRGRLNDWAVRVILAGDISDNWKARISVSTGYSASDAPSREPVGTFPAPPPPGPEDVLGYVDPPSPYVGGFDRPNVENVRNLLLTGRLDGDLGFATLTSITSYGRVTRYLDNDADASPNDLFNVVYQSRDKYRSQEFRLAGETSNFNWIVGFHYYHNDSHNPIDLIFFRCLATPGACTPKIAIPQITMQTVHDPKTTSYAGFGEVTWDLSDQWSITAGLRYTSEERTLDGISTRLTPVPVFPGYPRTTDATTWDNLSGKASISFKPAEDILLYGSVGTGFRSGTYNYGGFQRLAEIQEPVNPEKVTSYELGIKSMVFDRRVRFNAAVFAMDYTNLQVNTIRGTSVIIENAASARIWGAEAELTVAPVTGLRAVIGAGYLDTEYRNYNTMGPSGDLSGNTLVNSPRLNLNARISYEFPITAQLAGFIGADGRYQSKVYFRPENDLSQSPYGVVNLRAGVRAAKHDLQLQFWVKNLFDRRYLTDANRVGAPLFEDLRVWSEPRMYGATLSFEF